MGRLIHNISIKKGKGEWLIKQGNKIIDREVSKDKAEGAKDFYIGYYGKKKTSYRTFI